jgi:predicted GNAT family acetyltransferase
MVGDGVEAPPTPSGGDTPVEIVTLGPADVPGMMDLVEASRPGPFLERTVEFGGYRGVRESGRLVAMAGERLRPPGHAEISAVTTDPDHRRRGLARRLVLAVADDIVRRGETPFLHASATNVNAIRLYEALGFTLRRTITFQVLEAEG